MAKQSIIAEARFGSALVSDSQLPTSPAMAEQQRHAISRGLRRAARKARAPASIVSGGAGIRGRKGDKAFRIGLAVSFALLVLVPLIAETVYWGFVASKQYATEVKFTVRSGEPSPLDAIGGLLSLSGSQQAQDTRIVLDYIRSRAMVEELDKSLDLRRIYSRPDVDWFSRFDPSKSTEELLKYWEKRTDATIEAASSILAFEVRAFTPEDAMAIATAVSDLSEKLVNNLATRARRDAVSQAKAETAHSERRLENATVAMRDARNAEGVLDATGAAEALTEIITALQLDLSRAEADLSTQGAALQDSPQSRLLQARIAAIKAQIADYSNQIAGARTSKSANMAEHLNQLSRKQTELDLARQQYSQAALSLESSRVDLEQQHTYLLSFVKPTLAQKSTYPRRGWQWSIVMIPLMFGWLILASVAVLVRDNMAK